MADIISCGIAPAILSFAWGLQSLGRLGWAAGFMFVAAAAMRLARFNIQSGGGGDKRYFVGLPSPAAAGVIAATVFAYPDGLYDYRAALPALGMVLVPAALMVSTIRFRSSRDVRLRRTAGRYTVLIFVAAGMVAIATHPQERWSWSPTSILPRGSSDWRSPGSSVGARRPRRRFRSLRSIAATAPPAEQTGEP
jgi:CDP-diacylglycerol--serine O-phosphatidyltransferase